MRSSTLSLLALIAFAACTEAGPPPFGAPIELRDAADVPPDEGPPDAEPPPDAGPTADAPTLLEVDPPQSVFLGGRQRIAFTWRSEAPLVDVRAWAVDGPEDDAGRPVPALDREDDATWPFELRVDEGPGETVWLRVEAFDAAGGHARRRFQWTAGEHLQGEVVPGPAAGMDVLIEQEGDGDRAWRPLASATTDAQGRFGLILPPGLGALRLTATPTDASLVADLEGERAPWGRTVMQTVVPAHRKDRPVLVSPWGDLAYRLALRDSVEEGGRLAERQAPRLAALSAHFGLLSSDGVVFGPVYDPAQVTFAAFDEDTRLRTLALRCFLGASAAVGGHERLIERLRDDAEDGRMTGRWVNQRVEADPIRRDLATGCDLPVAAVREALPFLNHLIHNEDPVLFGEPEAARGPDQPPTVALALREEEGRVARLEDGAWAISGPVLVRVEGADDRPSCGDVEADVDGIADALEVIDQSRPSFYRRVATYRIDPARLAAADGQTVRVRVRLTDGAGQTTQQVVALVLARAPVAPVVRPMSDAFRTSPTTWHTRSAVAQPVAATVAFGALTDLELTADGVPVPAVRAFGQERHYTLPIDAWAEGRYRLVWRGLDLFGRPCEAARDLVVDRTAPAVTWLATRYADERAATVDLTPDGPVLHLPAQDVEVGPDSPQPIPVRKLGDRLGADDANLPELRWRLDDAAGLDDLRVEVEGGAPLQRQGDEWVLPITGALTGFDRDGIPRGALWPREALHLVVEDAAGNTTTVALPTFVAEPAVPPLHVAPLEAAGPASLADVRDARGPQVVGRWRVTNPWPQPIRLRLPAQGELQVVGETALRPAGGQADVLGPGVVEGDQVVFRRPGQIERYVRLGCLAADAGRMGEAAEIIEGPLDALRYQIHVYRCLDRQGEGPLTGEAPLQLGWEGEAPARAFGDYAIGAGEAYTVVATAEGWDLRHGHPALADQLGGQAAGLDHAVFLDADDRARYLLYQPDRCVALGPCEHGYWLTRRVRALMALRLGHGPMALLTGSLNGPVDRPLALTEARELVVAP